MIRFDHSLLAGGSESSDAEPRVPEKELWTAVLIEAMCDYHSSSQLIRRSARQFFENRDCEDRSTCCETVCAAIFVQHEEIAAGILRLIALRSPRELKRLRKMKPGLASDDNE